MKLSDIKTFPAIVQETRYPETQYTVYLKHSGNFLAVDERDIPLFLDKNTDYTLVYPKLKLRKYLMRSTDSHLPIRPILTFHFESEEEYTYYKNQHSYELISYEGEVEVNDASGV